MVKTSIPKAGDLVHVECRDIDNYGNGISEWNKFILVTPELIPGEKAIVEIKYKSGSMWMTSINKFLSRSVNRIIPECDVFSICGGCSLQHIAYSEQWRLKVQHTVDLFSRIGKLSINIHEDFRDMNNIYHYRNRAIIPVEYNQKNNIIKLGYYERKTHNIIDINKCPILDKRLSSLILPIKTSFYNELNNNVVSKNLLSGIRHISLRISNYNNQILMTIVSCKDYINEFDVLAEHFMNTFFHLSTVSLNIQSEDTNKIFGTSNRIIAGEKNIEESFCGIKILIDSNSFFQINLLKAERICKQIIKWLYSDYNTSTVIDAYCGLGTLSLPISKAGFNVIGLEINTASVDLAKQSAINNKLNINFVAGDVKNNLDKYLNRETTLIIDPPRKGLDNYVVNIILEKKPKKIAYLSCNPSTLARDARLIIDSNFYKVEYLYPIDFFPQTTHLECLLLFSSINF